jgi:serine/threonine protein kinase
MAITYRLASSYSVLSGSYRCVLIKYALSLYRIFIIILSDQHFRYFFHQLLCGVKYMHLNRIIHRYVIWFMTDELTAYDYKLKLQY